MKECTFAPSIEKSSEIINRNDSIHMSVYDKLKAWMTSKGEKIDIGTRLYNNAKKI